MTEPATPKVFLLTGTNFVWFSEDEEPESQGIFLEGPAFLSRGDALRALIEATEAFCALTSPQDFPMEFERYSALAGLHDGDTDQITWDECFNAGFPAPYEILPLDLNPGGHAIPQQDGPVVAGPAVPGRRVLQLRR